MLARHHVAAIVAAALLAATAGSGSALAAPALPDAASDHVPVCPRSAVPEFAHCHAYVVTANGKPAVTTLPAGLSPAVMKSAYGFSTSSSAGAGATIAIVDAYDDPTAESDLGVFSSTFGLPSCTIANGCFNKVNQRGGVSYPAANAGWAIEISLDVQWAHAIAPGAKILLVEADSSSFANLLAAVDYAKVRAGYVSMSWGGGEPSTEATYDAHFSSGRSYFASSGDAGLGAEYPSSSPAVISVGGTTLTSSAGIWTEAGWSGSGGGCSAYEIANAAQSTGSVNCGGKRATPDVSLDADPASGAAVYDSTRYQGQKGWFVVGGTSLSAPMWAARSAARTTVTGPVDAAYVYGASISFRDIISGNNGASALPGYDLVTGRGSWIGATP